MNTHAEKTQENKSQSVSAVASRMQGSGEFTFQFVDNRPEAVAQRKLQEMANNSLLSMPNNPLTIRTESSLYFPHQLKPVVQKKILVGNDWKIHYDDTLVTEQYNETKPYINQWKQMDTIFAAGTKNKTREAKEKYLKDDLGNDIRAMLRKYNEKKNFDDDKDLTRQLVQDIKLKLLRMESIIGIDHQDGQFSKKADDISVGRTGKDKTLRIYRTMSTEDWNKYEDSKDPKDILKGHGGSLGQALHYYLKSKKDNLDDVLVEFEFSQKAQNLVDYTRIQHGGEGKEPYGGKLTGKKEGNDIMDLDEDIFSINLSKSKELISELKPKISLKDKVRD